MPTTCWTGLRVASFPPQTAGAAYVFLAPGVTAYVRYGVLTDLDLISEARSRFNLTRR
jgi:hypothetical protein